MRYYRFYIDTYARFIMLRVCKATLKTNEIRQVVHNGSDHVIVPVVMIVDGVLNGALVTHEEYGLLVEAWNDKPVTISHPQVNGEFVSAGSPDIIEKSSIGRVYNAHVEGDKLVGELWLDSSKADRIGRQELLAVLKAGEVVEVSTGYFSAREDKQGEFKGKPYVYIDRDIVPDHLALLPAEVGACSVQDGCGTRQPNVFTKIAQAFGFRANHTEEEHRMCTKSQMVEKLVGNAKLSPEQIDMLMGLDPEQLAMMQAIAGALSTAVPAEVVDMEDEVKPDMEEMVANAVAKALAANANTSIIDRIVANEANVFTKEVLKAMSAEELEKYEQSIRPVDYSGAGAPVVNSTSSNVKPMLPRKLGAKK